MYLGKVEICGVNTARLKVLKEKEKIALMERVAKGDKKAREEMINGNLKLVLSVIQRFAGRGEMSDDLFQVGCIGLMKAIDHFDLSLGLRFSTYAVPMIAGEVRRHLRDNNMVRVTRSLRDLAYRAMQAKEQLIYELHREPTMDEIAQLVNVPRADIVLALEAITDPLSLDEPVNTDSGDTLYLMDQTGDKTSDLDWLAEMSIRQTLSSLPPREQRILALRFYQGKTQMEVAKEIGISQAQVSRLEKSAIDTVKRHLEGEA